MPVFEQGYRAYVGPRTTRPSALSIAWENIRPRLRWWVWLLMFVLLFIPFAIASVGIFLAANGFGPGAAGNATPLTEHIVAYGGPTGPNAVLAAMRGASTAIYWSLFDGFWWAPIIIPAVACAGLLAADRRTGALQIYFARPVSRLDYMTGKVLAGAFFAALTTVVPGLLLWIEVLAFGSSAQFTWRTWTAPLAVVGAGAVYTLWTLGLVVSLSSVMRRPAYVALVAVFLDFVVEGIGKLLSHTFHDDAWSMMQPSRAIGIVTTAFFDVDLPKWANVPTALGIAVGIPLALLAFTWSRVRAVEVST